MRSRLVSQTTHSALRPGSGVSMGDIAIRIAAPGARTATRAALLGSVCIGALAMLGPGTAHAVDGTWTGPGGEWTTGTNWSSSPTVPDNTASFANNGAPTAVTISNNAAINTIDFAAAAPAYSFTVQNGANFTVNSTSNSSSFKPDFSVSSGATLAVGNGGTVEIGSLAGGGALQLGTSDPNTLLFIAGSTSTTYSGVISGPGSIELDDAASLRLTGTGSVIGGDLDLCLCSTGSLTIDGGSLTVNGFAQGVAVEGGTLSVINGGTLQVGPTSGFFGDLLVASNMVISGPGSTVTVSAGGFTGIGLFGPGALTISNGGVLSSQGGAEVNSFFGGPATVVVTGAGSQWNIGGLGLSVGGGTTGGPGTLTISGGGVVTTNVAFIGDSDDGSSFVLVTGTGSRLNATVGLSIGDGGCGCGPLVGTLTIADGGAVEAADTRILAGSTLKLGTGALGGTLITPTILNDGAIVADFTDGVTLSADISGSGTLSKAGTGKLILSGNNSYAGGTTVTGGTLSMTNGNAVGTGLLTLGGGTTLQLDGTFAVANNIGMSGLAQFDVTAGNTATVNGGIVNALASPAPPGALEKTGTGTLVLSGVNTYSGGTVISAGILRATNAGAIGTGAVTLNGGTFQAGANALNFSNAFALNSAGGMIDTNGFAMTITGNITNGTGSGPLIKTGAGTLTLAGTNTYSGGTMINAGTLAVAADTNLGDASGGLTFNGGTLRFLSSFTTDRAVTLNAGGGTFDTSSNSVTLGGVIGGSGGLTKIGTGALTLFGANNYAGGTTVSAGRLMLGDGTHMAAIAGIVTNNADLQFVNADTSAITAITNTGSTSFFNTTTAGTAAITNSGAMAFANASSAGSAGITNAGTGNLSFLNTSSAGSATIVNSGNMAFANTATAGNANITNNLTSRFRRRVHSGQREHREQLVFGIPGNEHCGQRHRHDHCRRLNCVCVERQRRQRTAHYERRRRSGYLRPEQQRDDCGLDRGRGQLPPRLQVVDGRRQQPVHRSRRRDPGRRRLRRHRRIAGEGRQRHTDAFRRQHLFRRHDTRGRHAAACQQPGARHRRAHHDGIGGRLRQRRQHRQSDCGQQQHHATFSDRRQRDAGGCDLRAQWPAPAREDRRRHPGALSGQHL